MKRIQHSIAFILIIIYCFAFLPFTVNAAKIKYIIKADVIYKIYTDEKITLYIDTTKKVTWSTSSKKIATVTQKGVVTGIKSGDVTITAKVGKKKYKCKVQVWSREEEVVYDNDISSSNSSDFIDRYELSNYDTSLDNPGPSDNDTNSTSDRDLDGITEYNTFDYSDPYISEFFRTWIAADTLKKDYNISALWMSEEIWLIDTSNNKYIITGAPKTTFEDGKIYEGNNIKFQYIKYLIVNGINLNYNEIFFSIADLKAARVIK